MILFFVILIIIAAVALGFIVLVQNPKGGGLAGSFGGIGTQFMGVKQTTDILEKGTWVFGGIIAILCVFSSFFIVGGADNSQIKKGSDAPIPGVNRSATPATPAPNTTPLPQQP